jgi:large subunit ribosomal protein L23
MKDPTEIIIRPLLTEKSTLLQGRLSKYTFEVAKTATKIEIRSAVEVLGKCEVASVNTVKIYGKERRTRRGVGRTPDKKKAIVTLKEGSELGGLLGQAYEGA